jgi:hypothetical protein
VFDEAQLENTERLPLSLFNDESTSATLLIAERDDTATEALTIPIGANPNTPVRPDQLELTLQDASDVVAEDLTVTDDAQGDTAQLPPPPLDTPATDETNSDTAEATEKTETLEDFLSAGSRLSARLTTGIAVSAGASTPVVALSDENWCTTPPCNEITWIGTATLDGSSRIQINFTEAVYKDALQGVSALALGAGNTPGLNAAVKDTTPTLAQDLLRSAVGGFSDYVGALQSQNKVTIIDGVAITETKAPPLDTFLLGRIGNLLALPEDSTPLVRIAEVPVDTAFVVLFGLPSGTSVPTE